MKAIVNKVRWYLLGGSLILSGLALLYFGFYGQSWAQPPWPKGPMLSVTPSTVAAQTNNSTLSVPASTATKPIHLSIPDVNINLNVADGYYNRQTQTWSLSHDKAHFAVMTARPNTEQGQTFIYGHNRNAVFTRLTQLRSGSLAYLTTADNIRFTYRFTKLQTTVPGNSDVLDYQGPPILTLQTCTGVRFQNRTLYSFELVGASRV